MRSPQNDPNVAELSERVDDDNDEKSKQRPVSRPKKSEKRTRNTTTKTKMNMKRKFTLATLSIIEHQQEKNENAVTAFQMKI